jgi:hypothetical protein
MDEVAMERVYLPALLLYPCQHHCTNAAFQYYLENTYGGLGTFKQTIILLEEGHHSNSKEEFICMSQLVFYYVRFSMID